MDGGAPLLRARGSCPVCGGDGDPLIRHNGFDIYSCTRCRTAYIHPLPSDAFLRNYYQDRNQYYFAKAEKKVRHARRRLRWLKWFSGGGKFLDIGCHGGFTVEAARMAGFDAYGIDLDEAALDHARRQYSGCRFIAAPPAAFAREQPSEFALLHCAEVIEHVADARGLAAAAFALLRRGGYLYLTTPDMGHWRRPRDLTAWNRFVPPEHLIYYNPASLKLLLRQAGFAIMFHRHSLKPQLNLLARKP